MQRGRLVSVFLTPDFEPPRIEEEIVETDRGQRFDGVLRFDPELVVLLESKVCRRWARRNGHRVAEVNFGGVEFAERRTCLLRWHDLLESWWRLVEIGVLSPAEQMLVGDLLGYAHQDFAELLPFGSLRRVGEDPLRRRWRLRSLLREATSIQPERVGLVHVRLDTGLGAKSLQRAALEIDDRALTLHLWPGELKPQAQALYRAGRAERLAELDEGAGGPWRVAPQPLLGFRSAPKRVRVYLTCTLDAATYARRWQGEDWAHVGAHHRDKVLPELWPWLLERGYASPEDEERLERFMQTLGRRALHLRPAPARLAHVVVRRSRGARRRRPARRRDPRGDQPRARRARRAARADARRVGLGRADPAGRADARQAHAARVARNRASARACKQKTQSLGSSGSSRRSDRVQEQPVHAVVVGQLGVERDREHVPLARGHGMAVDLGEDLDAGAVLGDPRRADEHRPQRAAVDARAARGPPRSSAAGARTRCARRACPSGRGGRGRA